jgi:hypothetical protein
MADIPLPPTGDPPTRLTIPKLNLDVSVEAVGLVPSDGAPDVLEWGVPADRTAGWLGPVHSNENLTLATRKALLEIPNGWYKG